MIVKGDVGIAINPRALQILYRNQEVNYGVDFRGCKKALDDLYKGIEGRTIYYRD